MALMIFLGTVGSNFAPVGCRPAASVSAPTGCSPDDDIPDIRFSPPGNLSFQKSSVRVRALPSRCCRWHRAANFTTLLRGGCG
ncbi:uncharacterized protein LOC100621442 [Anopheles sinensis]|uniref:Uncharacterized protein LOC100621442 n=1 Tax=Anopheles sinensis TaxID=74873 RepID=A0A084WQ70_ANOSI|nr:uncharacterized protein LOC100621442 [Anopheles sinensis]